MNQNQVVHIKIMGGNRHPYSNQKEGGIRSFLEGTDPLGVVVPIPTPFHLKSNTIH